MCVCRTRTDKQGHGGGRHDTQEVFLEHLAQPFPRQCTWPSSSSSYSFRSRRHWASQLVHYQIAAFKAHQSPFAFICWNYPTRTKAASVQRGCWKDWGSMIAFFSLFTSYLVSIICTYVLVLSALSCEGFDDGKDMWKVDFDFSKTSY